jgi:hypothetical protein
MTIVDAIKLSQKLVVAEPLPVEDLLKQDEYLKSLKKALVKASVSDLYTGIDLGTGRDQTALFTRYVAHEMNHTDPLSPMLRCVPAKTQLTWDMMEHYSRLRLPSMVSRTFLNRDVLVTKTKDDRYFLDVDFEMKTEKYKL